MESLVGECTPRSWISRWATKSASTSISRLEIGVLDEGRILLASLYGWGVMGESEGFSENRFGGIWSCCSGVVGFCKSFILNSGEDVSANLLVDPRARGEWRMLSSSRPMRVGNDVGL